MLKAASVIVAKYAAPFKGLSRFSDVATSVLSPLSSASLASTASSDLPCWHSNSDYDGYDETGLSALPSTPGCGYTTFDAGEDDADDPLCVAEYVDEMYAFFREKEASVWPSVLKNNAWKNHFMIDFSMRSKLVGWLMRKHRMLEFLPETLHLAVSVLDRYMAVAESIAKRNIFLVGITCLLIASKHEEIQPLWLDDVVELCKHTCDRNHVRTDQYCSSVSVAIFAA